MQPRRRSRRQRRPSPRQKWRLRSVLTRLTSSATSYLIRLRRSPLATRWTSRSKRSPTRLMLRASTCRQGRRRDGIVGVHHLLAALSGRVPRHEAARADDDRGTPRLAPTTVCYYPPLSARWLRFWWATLGTGDPPYAYARANPLRGLTCAPGTRKAPRPSFLISQACCCMRSRRGKTSDPILRPSSAETAG
jgi:hypothetical protein